MEERKVKAIKMLGLIVLTALIATAFGGVTSAIAESTALCKVDENPCVEVNQIAAVHEVSVGKAKVLTSAGTIECDVLFSGLATRLANPVVVSGGFTWTNCALGVTSCTLKELNGPSELNVLREGPETAKVTYEYLVDIACSPYFNCSYVGTGLGTAKGPLLSTQANGDITLSRQALTKEAGVLCPTNPTLDIITTPLIATYISR
jgi:hypothetical protein